jgi:hypothetical protein
MIVAAFQEDEDISFRLLFSLEVGRMRAILRHKKKSCSFT